MAEDQTQAPVQAPTGHMPGHTPVSLDLRFTLSDKDLVERFRSYVHARWGDQKGAYVMVLRQALRDFLDKQEHIRT